MFHYPFLNYYIAFLQGLKEIADSLSGGIGKSASDVIAQDSIDKTEEKPRNLLRFGLRNT